MSETRVHGVSVPPTPFVAMEGQAEVHCVPTWTDNLAWILVCRESREAAVVDGPEAQPILAYARTHDLNLTSIFNTHRHGDHIGINQALAKDGRLSEFRVVGAEATRDAIPGLTEAVSEGSTLRLGTLEGRVLSTEGHIDGHISYVFGDLLFCGDTLFGAGCGYLFDGPPQKMFHSLKRLAALDGGTKMCCAHEYTQDNLRFAWSLEPGNEALAQRIQSVWAKRGRGETTLPSTIAEERATNPFLRWESPVLREQLGRQIPEMPLDSDEAVFTAARALKDRGAYKERGDTGLPL